MQDLKKIEIIAEAQQNAIDNEKKRQDAEINKFS